MNTLPELVNSGVFASERRVNFHAHPGTELVLLTHGYCSMEVGGTTLSGGPGTLFILPSRVEHSQDNAGLVRTVYCSFNWTAGFDESPRTLPVDRWVRLWMAQIHRMRHDMRGGFDAALPGVLYALLKRVEWLEASRGEAKSLHPALALALDDLERRLDQPSDLDAMARRAGVSSSYLCALFHQQFARGPVSMALEAKMRYAERLLRDPHLTVKEVAGRCGFDDPNYFSRLFRKRHGRAPGEYRRTSD